MLSRIYFNREGIELLPVLQWLSQFTCGFGVNYFLCAYALNKVCSEHAPRPGWRQTIKTTLRYVSVALDVSAGSPSSTYILVSPSRNFGLLKASRDWFTVFWFHSCRLLSWYERTQAKVCEPVDDVDQRCARGDSSGWKLSMVGTNGSVDVSQNHQLNHFHHQCGLFPAALLYTIYALRTKNSHFTSIAMIDYYIIRLISRCFVSPLFF